MAKKRPGQPGYMSKKKFNAKRAATGTAITAVSAAAGGATGSTVGGIHGALKAGHHINKAAEIGEHAVEHAIDEAGPTMAKHAKRGGKIGAGIAGTAAAGSLIRSHIKNPHSKFYHEKAVQKGHGGRHLQ